MIISAKTGFVRGIRWTVDSEPIVLGRSNDCDIVVDDATVSRRQCKLWVHEGVLHLQDLGGVNPALVNGKPARDGVLREGDELTVGCATFRIAGIQNADPRTPGPSADPDTRTLSVEDFYERRFESLKLPEQFPALQSDYLLIFHLTRALASHETPTAIWRTVRQTVASRFPDTYLWNYQCDGDELRLITGATKDLVREPLAPLAREALSRKSAILNNRLNGVSETGVITAPLLSAAKPVGVLVVVNEDTQPPFSDSDLITIMAIAELTGPFLDAVIRSSHLRAAHERIVNTSCGVDRLVGASKATDRLRKTIVSLANTSMNILIQGETGTGKELVALALHELSPRANGPFVAINCAAIPPNLFESEFFGHKRGAFSGAVASKKGFLDRANGGTLFLDEVGDLTLENQAKLLRAIEYGKYVPVGATTESATDLRVIAATNVKLKTPDFREDLYHRLAMAKIEIQPLRKRPSDIPLLARHFLDRLAAQDERLLRTLSLEAEEKLCKQFWSGNVRELRNTIERAVHLTSHSEIHVKDLSWPDSGSTEAGPIKSLLEVEADHISYVLEMCDGNMKEAARVLGISRSSLYNKVPRHERSQ